MTAAIHKNWKGICALTDVYLKIFLTLCRDADVLRKVAMGFPELFQAEASMPVFPLSLIKVAAGEWLATVGSDKGSSWNDYLEERLHIPVVACYHATHEYFSGGRDSGIVMPYEVVGQYRKFSKQVDIRRLKSTVLFPWKKVDVTLSGEDYFVIWINVDGDTQDSQKDFYVVPCASVDLNS